MTNYKEKLRHITTFIFDYDGVLSDGTVLMLESGDLLRTGYVKDGYAIHLALKKGYNVAVISGGYSESMAVRCKMLGIKDTFFMVNNKMEAYEDYRKARNLKHSEILYMGDDIPDYLVMQKAGVPVCPADAAEEIKSVSVYISQYPGGKGCVRDIIEQVLKIQGKWMDKDAFEW